VAVRLRLRGHAGQRAPVVPVRRREWQTKESALASEVLTSILHSLVMMRQHAVPTGMGYAIIWAANRMVVRAVPRIEALRRVWAAERRRSSALASKALFEGLVVDERGNFVDSTQVGGEAFYVVDDDGFQRHIESAQIDRQVLGTFLEAIRGNEELISEGTMRMLGQEDIFTKAAIDFSLKNLDAQLGRLIEQGLPPDFRDFLGMAGFRVVINVHGKVLEIEQPGVPSSDEELD
jgi:hypothetical protein